MMRFAARVNRPARILAAALALGLAASAHPKTRKAAPEFTVTVTTTAMEQVLVRGVLVLDGTARLVAPGFTPFELRYPTTSTLSGYFEVLDTSKELTLKIFDPAHSRVFSAAESTGVPRVRFAWAREGAGPRCVDNKKGGCPDAVAGREQMLALMEGTAAPKKSP